MDKMYYEIKNGRPINVDIQSAIDGAEYNCYDVIPFTLEDVMSGKCDQKIKKFLFVGCIDTMSIILSKVGFKDNYDLPTELLPYLSRDVKIMKCKDAIKETGRFIKPVKTKKFDGVVFNDERQKSYFHGCLDEDCYVSELVDIVSEYRVYIKNNEMIYSSNYTGDFKVTPDYHYVQKLIDNMKNKPSAFTIDVAILKNGKTELIEINDFWAIGNYGLYCEDYFTMLRDRYFEIIK